MNKQKILVTGASGFIGRALVKALEANYEVIGLSSKDVDITTAKISSHVPKVSHVFHLAAKTFVPDSFKMPQKFYEANMMGTLNVLEYCRETGASLTYASSYVYGPPEKLPISETHKTRANSPYNHSKLLAEELCHFYREQFKLTICTLRPFNIFGPFQSDLFLIPVLIKQLLDPQTSTIQVENLNPKRDYLYIDDFVAALVASIHHNGGPYNVGFGKSYSVREIGESLLKISGVNKELKDKNQVRQNEILDVVADIHLIKEKLSWSPQVTLEEGLKKTWEASKHNEKN